jgi:hypothetical protein
MDAVHQMITASRWWPKRRVSLRKGHESPHSIRDIFVGEVYFISTILRVLLKSPASRR